MTIFEVATLPWRLIDGTFMRISMFLGYIHKLFRLPLPLIHNKVPRHKIVECYPWYWRFYLRRWLRHHRFEVCTTPADNGGLIVFRRPTGPSTEYHDNWEQLEYHIYDMIEEYKLSNYEKSK